MVFDSMDGFIQKFIVPFPQDEKDAIRSLDLLYRRVEVCAILSITFCLLEF